MTFLQRLNRGRFNADKDFFEPGLDHQGAQFRVIGEIHGRFGEKSHAGPRALPPLDQRAQQCLGPLFVANEIVVHNEHHVLPPAPAQRIQLGNQLRRRFRAGHASVHHDDVAKFAIERAATRELHGHRHIISEFDEVPARHRGLGDFRTVRAAINGLQPATPQVFHDLWHHFLGLAQNEVLNLRECFMPGGEQRSACDDGLLQGRAPRHDFVHRILLHQHRAQQHIIRPAQVFILEPLHVQVHQLELPLRRQHRGHRQQSQRRHGRLSGNEAHSVLETPERVGRSRADEKYFH